MLFELRTPALRKAWREISRADFLPERQRQHADLDQPLPIGRGQTISQPSVVAFMLEKLKPEPGGHYLDVGSGSGWTTALLAHVAGEKGKVWAIEIIPELKEFGEKNVSRYNFIEKGVVEFIRGDGSRGYEERAPFDGILVSASADRVPENLKSQLKIGGRLVVPVGQSIHQIIRRSAESFEEKEFPGFIFVPLVS